MRAGNHVAFSTRLEAGWKSGGEIRSAACLPGCLFFGRGQCCIGPGPRPGARPSDRVTTTVIRMLYVQAVRALDTPARRVRGVAFGAARPRAGAIWPLTAWRPAVSYVARVVESSSSGVGAASTGHAARRSSTARRSRGRIARGRNVGPNGVAWWCSLQLGCMLRASANLHPVLA